MNFILVLLFILLPSTSFAAKASLAQEDIGVCNPLRFATARTDGTLTTAIASTGTALLPDCSGGRILLIPTGATWTIANDLTIPSRMTVKIPAGASITVNSGKTLTLGQPPDCDQPINCLLGSGTVAFDTATPKTSYALDGAFLGAECDGVTDDAAALQKANTLPTHSTVILPNARCIIASTVTFTKTINIIGQGALSELYCTMGTGTNCIEIDNGAAAGAGTLTQGTLWRDFSIVGAASSALNCAMVRNITRASFERVYIMCGTSAGGSGLWVQDFALESYFNIIQSGSLHENPFTSGTYAIPTDGVRFTSSTETAGTFNANEINLDLTSNTVGLYIFSGAGGGNGNNDIRGTYQGITGLGVHVQGGSGMRLHDLHMERGSSATGNEIKLEDVTLAHVGPNVSVANSISTADHLQLVNADMTRIDGYIGGRITIDSASSDTIIGNVVTNAAADSIIEDLGINNNTHYQQPVGISSTLIRLNGVHSDGSSYLINGSAERWDTTSTIPPGWAQVGSAPTYAREATIVKHGLYSNHVSAVTTSNQPAIDLLTAALNPMLAGQQIAVSGWIYIPTSGGGDVTPQFYFAGGAATAGLDKVTTRDTWTHISGTFEANAGSHATVVLRFLPDAGSIEFYLDGFSAVPSLTGTPSWYTQNPNEYASFGASLTVDPGSAATLTTVVNAGLVVPGAAANDFCQVGPPAAALADLMFSCIVTAADTVEMRTHNIGPSTRDQASATFTFRVQRHP